MPRAAHWCDIADPTSPRFAIPRAHRLAVLLDAPGAKQAIATTGDGLEHRAIGAERLTNRGYGELQRAVVFVDEFARRLNQDPNDRERAAAKWHRGATKAQLAPGQIDLPPPRMSVSAVELHQACNP
jgi:hypothetical protein